MISVRNLYKEFRQGDGPVYVLNGVNVDFNQGERVAVIGPSGSGKSTFLRCINALETPTSGEILFWGKNVISTSKDIDNIRKDIGMVFQHFNLFNNMTILENITLAPIVLKIYTPSQARDNAIKLLEKVGLKDKANVYPSRLSGGQKQRIAIIRSMILKPKVMLFDEPTSALDPEMIKEVIMLMSEIAKSGMTMIAVTHEMSFVRKAFTRVLFMDGGKIIEDKTPEELFNNCDNVRVSKFLKKIS